MAEPARMVVYRTRGRWRENRGRVDLRVDGRIRGQLHAGGTIECRLPPGEHRVKVGREAPISGRMVFVGSPELRVPMDESSDIRVRVEPSGIPLRQQWQLQLSESSYRLSVDGTDVATPLPTPAPDAPPLGIWALNLFTKSLFTRPRPWRSWQGAASVTFLMYLAWQLSVAARAEHIRPFGWVWLTFITVAASWAVAAWVSLYRARSRRTTRRRTTNPGWRRGDSNP